MANYTSTGPKGKNAAATTEKEDLANFISMITRDETPFTSSIGTNKATAIFHEWNTDELDTVRQSTVAEGTDIGSTFQNPDARARLGNYTQINSKQLKVSGTKRAVDQAGVADEYSYQLKKRGTEMRRDFDIHATSYIGGSTAAGTDAGANSGGAIRRTAGYLSFVGAGNITSAATVAGSGDADGTISAVGAATVLPAAASGTNAVVFGKLELSQVDETMQKIYEAGGKATKLMVSPSLRREFSAKAQAAGATASTGAGSVGNARRSVDDGALRQSVELYMSDFGDIMVVPNYLMGLDPKRVSGDSAAQQFAPADSTALIYDPMWWNVSSLRSMQEVDVGQQGDSTVGLMVEECALECRNPKGSGVIVGLIK